MRVEVALEGVLADLASLAAAGANMGEKSARGTKQAKNSA